MENPDPSVNIPGIYVGASHPGDRRGVRRRYVDYKAAMHITADQRVAYNRFPPVGGPHDGTWANCNGIVYATAVRNENMVHTLEHGAVWITYNPDTIAAGDLDILHGAGRRAAVPDALALPRASTRPISLQAWGHQLKLDSASDERVEQFITALRQNRWVYPETGATCQQPTFDVDESAGRSTRRRPARTRSRCPAPAARRPPPRWPWPSSDRVVDATASVPVTTGRAAGRRSVGHVSARRPRRRRPPG